MTTETTVKTSSVKRALMGALGSAAMATTLIAVTPTTAEAAGTYRYGPYIEYRNCVKDRNHSQANRRPNWSFGACYKMGPGAAG